MIPQESRPCGRSPAAARSALAGGLTAESSGRARTQGVGGPVAYGHDRSGRPTRPDQNRETMGSFEPAGAAAGSGSVAWQLPEPRIERHHEHQTVSGAAVVVAAIPLASHRSADAASCSGDLGAKSTSYDQRAGKRVTARGADGSAGGGANRHRVCWPASSIAGAGAPNLDSGGVGPLSCACGTGRAWLGGAARGGRQPLGGAPGPAGPA